MPFHRVCGVVCGSIFVLAAVGLAGCATPAPAAKQRLVVAIQPTLASTEMLEKSKPLERFLEDALPDVDVEVYLPLSQAGVIEALRFGQAHVAFLGAWPAHLAVRLAGAELVLAEVRSVLIDEEKKDATYYFSYWVVPQVSRHRSLADLRGTRACFPSPISTSGYVAPMGRLIELGLVSRPESGEVDPRAFFADVRFGGGYQQCWEALKGGQADVTVIAGDVPEKLYREVLGATRALDKQGPIPSHALVVSRELKDPLRARAVDAIARLGAVEHRELMRSFISGIFVGFERSTADQHLSALQRYIEQTGLGYTERLRGS